MAQKQATDSTATERNGAASAERITATDERGSGRRGGFEGTRALGRNLWRASLGTAITARQRCGKLYNRLVEKGARYQYLRGRASEQAETRPHTAEPKPSAAERLHSLEHNLEHRLDRGRDNTLHWIGVPSRKDFEALEHKVEVLTQALQDMEQQLHRVEPTAAPDAARRSASA